MPLPVAQLGYIPNVNVPQTSARIKPQNPWEQMAMQILGQAVAGGVKNVMTPEMSGQAQTAGIENAGDPNPWWKKLVMGPNMTPDQFERAKQMKQQSDLFNQGQVFQGEQGRLNEEAATRRQAESLSQAERLAGQSDTLHRDLAQNQIEAQAGLSRQHAIDAALARAGEQTFLGGEKAKDRATQEKLASDPDVDKKVAAQNYKQEVDAWVLRGNMARARNEPFNEPAPIYRESLKSVREADLETRKPSSSGWTAQNFGSVPTWGKGASQPAPTPKTPPPSSPPTQPIDSSNFGKSVLQGMIPATRLFDLASQFVGNPSSPTSVSTGPGNQPPLVDPQIVQRALEMGQSLRTPENFTAPSPTSLDEVMKLVEWYKTQFPSAVTGGQTGLPNIP